MVRRILQVVLLFSMLNGCTSPATTPGSESTDNGAESTKSAPIRTQYPVTITDCGGRETTYDKAPERVVTIDPSVTEMLLVLGLQDKIVGYTEFYPPDLQWASTKTEMATLQMVNDGANYPVKETVVALNPDLVTSVYEYAFMDPLPDRDGWKKLGVNSYQTLCPPETQSDFSLLYQDLRNLGILFDVQARAEAEIEKLQTRVLALQQKVKDAGLVAKKIAIYDGTVDHPPIYGGTIHAVLALAGLSYVWADFDANSVPSWEQFVAADPEVIWIVPDAGSAAETLKQQLESDPRLKNIAAVQNKAYIVVPQAAATIESPRLVDGLEQVINGLLALQGTAIGTKRTVIVESCGRKLTFVTTPERVMVTYPNVAETLATLGLTSKIAAVNFGQSTEPPATIAAEINALKYLNERGKGVVSKEIALHEQPDLVIVADPTGDLDGTQGFATRADYETIGAKVYELNTNCVGREGDSSLDTVYTDILNFGDIFGARQRAQTTVQAMENQISEIQAKIAGKPPVRVAIYGAGEGPLGFYAGGLYAELVTLAGGVNVFADLPDSYAEVSTEGVANSNVELFIIDDYPGAKPAAERAEYLFKTFPNLPAAQNKRWLAVQDIQFAPGIRNASGVLDIAKALYPEAFTETSNAVTSVSQRSTQ